MKLIKNYIDVRTDCEDNFLIHPYCGEIYVIGKKEIKMLSKWSRCLILYATHRKRKNSLIIY